MLERVRGLRTRPLIAGLGAAVVVAAAVAAALLLLGGDGDRDQAGGSPTPTASATLVAAATSRPSATETTRPSVRTTPSPTPTAEPTHLPRVTPAPAGRVTALLLGLDRRPPPIEDPHGPNRSDIIQIVTYDLETGRAALIGIPRDTFVPIPGAGRNRINTAYYWGVSGRGTPQAGLDLAERTVESNFRIPIDFVIAVDFDSFARLVDDMGGVPIEVPENLADYHISDPGSDVTMRLRPGAQVGGGPYVLSLARARPDGDLNRLRRVQGILTGMFTELRSMNVFEMTTIWLQNMDGIETNLEPVQWPRLIDLAFRVEPAAIEYYSVGDFVSPYTTPEGAAVLLPNMGGIDAMLDEVFGDDRLQ